MNFDVVKLEKHLNGWRFCFEVDAIHELSQR